ncbi:putative GPN-loop GTPase, P-loop containing nucleoside triphosphate hydrolase [Septoria linicola]|nr:putative GPN-loop GTPase, P-loop containing nucleoside triphosphate hydrolase [Septoria linicola]
MRTILLPIGPPGAGKSTLCNGLQQFMRAVARSCSVGNLDPANENIPYDASFDVRDFVSVDEVMDREELGPNGGVLWAMEEIETNIEWLEQNLAQCEETIILDPPGQPELTIHHQSLPNILHRLEKRGYRIVIIQLLDSVVLTRPSLYLSSLLLCLRGPLHLPYPVVNVLTKIDNLKSVGGAELPFNLDFYTEVQDLHHLLPALSQEQAGTVGGASGKWDALNEAIISLIEDYGLMGFETLAVEDRQSMAALLRAIDRASGYVFAGARGTDESGRTLDHEASIWAQAMSENYGKMDVRDVQERWIERKEEYDELEKKQWEEEARLAGALPEQPAASVKRKEEGSAREGMAEDDGEDELVAEQRKWQEEQAKAKGSASTKVARKGLS